MKSQQIKCWFKYKLEKNVNYLSTKDFIPTKYPMFCQKKIYRLKIYYRFPQNPISNSDFFYK